MRHIPRPLAVDSPSYFAYYMGLVPENDILRVLADQAGEIRDLFAPLGDDGALHRYAPGKWSLKEMVGHLADTERMFCYRAMSFARGDATDLPGMDEDAWVAGADFDAVPLADLLAEFFAVRESTVRLFANMDDAALARRGRANGMAYRVSCVPWLVVGHVRHHLGVVRERYLD